MSDNDIIKQYLRLMRQDGLSNSEFYADLDDLMFADIRLSKLIFRTILQQRSDWQCDVEQLEEAMHVDDCTNAERERSVVMIDGLRRDIKYLDRLLAVEYPSKE